MDFTLSLAHFCEIDGPTSILCTQAVPVSCRTCWGPRSTESSIVDLRSYQPSAHSSHGGDEEDGSSAHSSTPSSPVQKHKTFRPLGEDAGCASCTFNVPDEYTKKLPSGAPGSPKEHGLGSHGSPVLRSRERHRVWGSPPSELDADEESQYHASLPNSVGSSNTTISSFHEHRFECRTTSNPSEPSTYAMLRRACLQTLSREQLLHGLGSGRLSFEDDDNGLTIAWKFWLQDPHARGQKRYYALLAVAKPGPTRAMKASPIIWSCFERLVYKIKADSESILSNGQGSAGRNSSLDMSNVSSFLTGRTVDPDGFPRAGGISMKARNLVEIVGDRYIFPWIHKEFARLLQSLAQRFGETMVEPED
ncbi:MAG: hypothetical protein Q9168_004795 [Polycauliona sp. 1 TL-2023]